MANVISYAREELDTFEVREFCPVDSLVFSYLSYLELPDELAAARTHEGMRIAELYRAEYFESYFYGLSNVESRIEALAAICASPRFRDLRICEYRAMFSEEDEMQFCAMTYVLPDGTPYVAFKGTDSSFIGWKEDFNLIFQCPVPSQTQAALYLNEMGEKFDRPLYVGGHSKGGNLAIYAAAICNQPVKDCIIKVFSHDGPGFLEDFIQSAVYMSIADRVEKTVPDHSFIGMLLEEGEYLVVKSDAHGFMQHDPSTWVIEGAEFVYLDELNERAIRADRGIGIWLADLTFEEREEFVESLYYVIEETGVDAIEDVTADRHGVIRSALKALKIMDPDKKARMMQNAGELLSAAIRGN